MENFSKTVRVGKGQCGNVYCQIKFNEGNLSISGVEGPLQNGDAKGGCGQIIMHDWGITTFAGGWSKVLENEFRAAWDKWHLNDLKANCEHQVGDAWTGKEVCLYHFSLNDAVRKVRQEAEKLAIAAIASGDPFVASDNQRLLALLDSHLVLPSQTLPANIADYYTPDVKRYDWQKGFTELKNTGWLGEHEHPEGFLSKPCLVCGHKYGTKWLRAEVPAEVLDFLKSLPSADMTPAWV